MEALGFVQFYGLTPSIDLFAKSKIDVKADDRPLNVLVSECGDIRHILKTLGDIVPALEKPREHPINIYLHEKNLENLCRALLLLTVICETQLSQRERMELFLDLYANSMIRERTNAYLQSIVQDLIQLVTEDTRCQSALKDLVNFDLLRFQQRDNMEDVISSYLDVHQFDIEKHRDTRLRAHFKERYDFRKNLTDWDY